MNKKREYYEQILYNEKYNMNIIIQYPIVHNLEEAQKHNKELAKKVFSKLAMVVS